MKNKTKLLGIVTLLTLLFVTKSNSQSPYQISWQKDSGYLGLGISSKVLSLYLSTKVEGLTAEEIYAMDRSTVNGFDRSATFNHSPNASKWSDILLMSSHTLPSLFLLNKKSRKDFGKIILLFGEAYLLNSSLTLITKSISLRPRPYVFNEDFEEGRKMRRTARFSFFSGHTSTTATNCFFVAKVFSDYFPDSKLKPFVWGAAVTIPALTGYFRVAAGKHYPSDVIVGYTVGAAIGILIPHLHKKKQHDSNLSFYPGIGGGSLVWRF